MAHYMTQHQPLSMVNYYQGTIRMPGIYHGSLYDPTPTYHGRLLSWYLPWFTIVIRTLFGYLVFTMVHYNYPDTIQIPGIYHGSPYAHLPWSVLL